jgi:cell fate (sporulation/competence/biofilm development) regulator YlbF (YheA/YmcA/DUF963 family)
MGWVILGWVVGIHVLEIVGVLFYLLLKKNNKLEQIVVNQNNYINAISIIANQMDDAVKQIDTKVWVEGDEELKAVFENFKNLQTALKEVNDSVK